MWYSARELGLLHTSPSKARRVHRVAQGLPRAAHEVAVLHRAQQVAYVSDQVDEPRSLVPDGAHKLVAGRQNSRPFVEAPLYTRAWMRGMPDLRQVQQSLRLLEAPVLVRPADHAPADTWLVTPSPVHARCCVPAEVSGQQTAAAAEGCGPTHTPGRRFGPLSLPHRLSLRVSSSLAHSHCSDFRSWALRLWPSAPPRVAGRQVADHPAVAPWNAAIHRLSFAWLWCVCSCARVRKRGCVRVCARCTPIVAQSDLAQIHACPERTQNGM